MAEKIIVLAETITALIESKKYSSIRDILLTMQAVDIAAVFEEIPQQKIPLLFRILPKDLAADTFVEMPSELREYLIRSFSDNELKAVIDELYLDDTVDIVEEMPANIVKRILEQANSETRHMINEMLKYPADSAGSIMTTEYVDLYPNMTITEAIEHIRETGVDKETINVCYVTNVSRQLVGEVSIRTLILASSQSTVESVMTTNTVSVGTQEDKEDVAHVFTKYGCIVVPVVDSENRLVGIVTVDDAMNVLRDETTEDIDKMAAITPSDKPYLKL
ncbi:MAG: magnesium transporter, partial [Eubacteriales bacterium]